jgi:hypothetical protein
MRGRVFLYQVINIILQKSGHTRTPQILNLLHIELKYNGTDFLKIAHLKKLISNITGYRYDTQRVIYVVDIYVHTS